MQVSILQEVCIGTSLLDQIINTRSLVDNSPLRMAFHQGPTALCHKALTDNAISAMHFEIVATPPESHV